MVFSASSASCSNRSNPVASSVASIVTLNDSGLALLLASSGISIDMVQSLLLTSCTATLKNPSGIAAFEPRFGFPQAWKFKRVFELSFKKGALVDGRDVSSDMESFRDELEKDKDALSWVNEAGVFDEAKVMRLIEASFNRKYVSW